MDALAAILMPGFNESNWTDQEVGIAIGRGVLVIPVMRGATPYRFISKCQGLHAEGNTVTAVSENIFEILIGSPKTRTRMLSCLIETTVRADSEEQALKKIDHLDSIRQILGAYLEQLRDSATSSVPLTASEPQKALNNLLAKYKLKPVVNTQVADMFDDEIPF